MFNVSSVSKFTEPFDYFIIDNFLDVNHANKLSEEFVDYNHSNLYVYENPLENKKAFNDYHYFPDTTYKFFTFLNSPSFVNYLEDLTKIKPLYPDYGLHGAGWHMHTTGGKLNIHQDYEIHPKLNLQRKLNFILYLTKDWDINWGGNLEFWSHDNITNEPKEKIAVVANKFNRVVIFDTSQHSWHGFPVPICCPQKVLRKSIATYYLTDINETSGSRKRALYALTEEQKNNPDIVNFAIKRSM